MKFLLCILVALAVANVTTLAQTNTDTNVVPASAPESGQKIGAADAKQYIGKQVVVTGKVAEVHMTESVVRLNIDKAFPSQPFTAVIFAKQTNKFSNLPQLKGKDVEISGKIAEYRSRPEIVLNSTNQLRVLPDEKK